MGKKAISGKLLIIVAGLVAWLNTTHAQTLHNRYYVLNPSFDSQAISVMSLSDGNTISAGLEQLTLDRFELGEFSANAGITPGSEIKATGAFTPGSGLNRTDLPVPAWFQGTHFVVPHIRKTHSFRLLSPGSDANVTIQRGASSVSLSLNRGEVLVFDAGSDNSISSIIDSDVPVLVMHTGMKSGSLWGDVFPVPPAANELWGVRSKNIVIGASQDATSITVYASGGASQTYSVDAGGRLVLNIGSNTSQGRGDAIRISADKPVSAVQYADSDGSDAVAFWPRAYLGTTYAIPVDTQYVAVACLEADTQLTLYDGAAVPLTKTCSGSVDSYPGKAYFGSASNGVHIQAGAYIQSNKPVYVYHEVSASNDEHQLTGHKNSYYVLDPWQQESPLSVMSLADNNVITAGSTSLFLDEYQIATIPAGQDLEPGRQISGVSPFDLGNAADGSDIPVPSSFLGMRFAVPHIQGYHSYDLLSPLGDAQLSISIDGEVQSLSLPQGQVVVYRAGNNNTIAGLISSSRPILVYHRAQSNADSGTRYDTYPVAPMAEELWGIQSISVYVSSFEDNTSVNFHSENGQTQSVVLSAGETYAVAMGDQTGQGAGSAIHIVADKPVSGVRFGDGDGGEATSLWPVEYRGNKFGIPVSTQYIAVVCIDADTRVILVRADNSKQLERCSANGNSPGKVLFGSVINGENIAAGAYVESDKPIFLYYENADTDDEKSVLGALVKPSLPPTAYVSVDVSQGNAPLSVQFDGSSSSDNGGSPLLAYQWNFGDSTTGNGAALSNTYTQSGSYTATLTVINGDGRSDQASQQIIVGLAANTAPSAVLSALPSSGIAPLNVAFDASASEDSDGTIVSYSWDFGDGSTSIALAPSHAYFSAGDYIATLTVTDDGGASDIETVNISVSALNIAPVVHAGLDQSINASDSAALDGTVSDDGLPNPPQAITIAWSKISGPGVVTFADASLVDTSASFSAQGDYVLRLSASDSVLSSSDDIQISVNASPSMELVYETGILTGVTDAWRTILTHDTYHSMVVIASLVLPDQASIPAVSRIRNANGNSFELRLQNPGNRAISGYDVHYFVVEEGVYNAAQHGIKMEAVRALSTQTAENSNWNARESRSYLNTYAAPVVVGQVMSEASAEWSVFWASSTNSSTNPPDALEFAAGKHVAEDPLTTRSNETIGYVVFDSGNSTIGDLEVYAALTADSVRGTENSSLGYSVPVNGLTNPGMAIVSSAAMDGSDGGWPVLFGATPVTSNQVSLAIDEDTLSNSERKHTTEQLALLVFDVNPPGDSVPAPLITSTNSNTESSTFNVEGTAQAVSEVRLYVNGTLQQSVGSDMAGAWQAEVDLLEGSNTIYATLWDDIESPVSNEITIIYTPDLPPAGGFQSTKIPQTDDQTTFHAFDDADIHAGTARSYTRDDQKETVLDEVNGLVWQDNLDAVNLTRNWSAASTYCQYSTQGGISDWRLPTILELAYLVDYTRQVVGSPAPLISSQFQHTFQTPDAQQEYAYWVNERFGDNGDYSQAGIIDFRDGGLSRDSLEDVHNVRCVSGARKFSPDLRPYNETAIDLNNGLMWQDNAELVYNRIEWSDALNYCENLELEGSSDWRLPNINEAQSIVNELFTNEASASALRYRHNPEGSNVDWWTSSTNARTLSWGVIWPEYDEWAWVLTAYRDILSGYLIRSNFFQSLSSKTFRNHVRCVRDYSFPVANAGGDRAVTIGELLSLDASASSDPDGGSITSYEWFDHLTGEILSTEATFNTQDLISGVHELELSVTDNHGLVASDTIFILVGNGNAPPTAVAGLDQTVIEGMPVFFDGSASSDSDGTIVTYEWKEGAVILGQVPNFSKNGFTLGEHIVTLTVSDDSGASATDALTVTIVPDPNLPPVANAGADQLVYYGAVVSFDGAASSDTDGMIVAYEWNEAATLLSQARSFTHDDFTLGDHVIRLTVIDDGGASASDEVLISVILPPNVMPVAQAGVDQFVVKGDTVSLDGSDSDDQDGTIDTFQWAQTGGTPVVLNNANSATASFTMPDISIDEPLEFRLSVSDDREGIASDTVTIRLNLEPHAFVRGDQRVDAGETVILEGFGHDEDGSIAEYIWLQLDGPAVSLSNASAASASFTMPALQAGEELLFKFTVVDDQDAAASQIVVISNIEEVSLTANTYHGIAPLEVFFNVETQFSEPINNFGMDYDGEGSGDGNIDETSVDPDVFAHTYEAVGVYSPYVFMLDEQGNEYFDRVTVEVVAKEEVQAEMKAQWDAMVAALMGGQIEDALRYFIEEVQEEYLWTFSNMSENKINVIFSGLSGFELISLNDGVAQCSAIRNETSGSYAYPVQFIKTEAGIWKITNL